MLENIATIGFFSADFSAVIWGVIIDRIAPPKALAYAAALACTALLIQGSAVLGSSSYPSGTADVFISARSSSWGPPGPASPAPSSSVCCSYLVRRARPLRERGVPPAPECSTSALVFVIFHALDYLGFGGFFLDRPERHPRHRPHPGGLPVTRRARARAP